MPLVLSSYKLRFGTQVPVTQLNGRWPTELSRNWAIELCILLEIQIWISLSGRQILQLLKWIVSFALSSINYPDPDPQCFTEGRNSMGRKDSMFRVAVGRFVQF